MLPSKQAFLQILSSVSTDLAFLNPRYLPPITFSDLNSQCHGNSVAHPKLYIYIYIVLVLEHPENDK